MQFLTTVKSGYIWYVQPKTTPIQRGTRIISDTEVEDLYTTIGFIPLNESERTIFNFLKQGKIAYRDNLTGTEFEQAYKQLDKGFI
jgi:hypothetical protein